MTGQPENPEDLAANLAERYEQAIAAFNEGNYGHTLQLLSQISKLKPDFDDREHLRQRVATALDQQQRNVVFGEAKARAETALEQGRWDDISDITAAMHHRLEAENLTLNDTQRMLVNQWGVSAGRRGGSSRAERATRAKRRLTPPTTPQSPPTGVASGATSGSVPKPASWLRRNREMVIGFVVLSALVTVLATVAFLEVSRSSEQGTETAGDQTDSEAETIPADQSTDDADSETETVAVDQPAEDPDGRPVQPADWIDMDQLRELWAIERQAIIDRLGSATANLSACPTGWSDTEGVEDGVIKLAATAPLSGVFISYGQSSAGMSEYFDQVNERGGIGPDGLQVELTVYDDAFDVLRTEEIVDDLLAGDQPFAITTFGTPNTLAVYDSLNGACVPQPTVQSNHPAWSDPENHPWTTGLDMSLATEAWLWGAWIDENLPYPVTVGALVMDNDVGRIYEQAFAEHAATSGAIESVEFVRHDPVAPSVTDEMAAIAALDPTVFISMTAANPCLMAINAAAETGLDETAEVLITPSMCTQVSAFLAPAGEAADGWLTFGGGFNDLVEPTARSGPYAEYVVESLFDAGLDGNDTLAADGFGKRAWTLHQILEVAANLEGGLTRSNLQLAQWGLNGMTHPSMIIGLEFGTANSFIPSFVNGSGISRFDATSQSWSLEGIIDQTGIVPPCRWVPELGCT